MNRFNFQLLEQFGKIAKPYWFSQEKWGAVGLFLLLIFLSLISTILVLLLSIFLGEVTSSLVAKDFGRFIKAIVIFLGVIVIGVPLLSYKIYIQAKLSLSWRRWLTNNFLYRYLDEQSFYQISFNSTIDNPDQRIAEDIKTFTQQSLNFVVILFDSILQLIGFTGLLWSISKLLMIFLIVYALFGTVLTTVVFGRIFISINFEQLKREANFRFGLVRLQENAEAIAFYQGQAQESKQLHQQFLDVFQNFEHLIRWQLNLNLFQNGYQYITFILPGLLLAPRILAGELEIGNFSTAGVAFRSILIALALIITQFDELSALGAGIGRLNTFAQSLKFPITEPPTGMTTINMIENSTLALRHLTLQTPDYKTILVKDVSLTVPPGHQLLIVGASGVGKSSLLRALAGLWNAGSGVIVRPKREQMLFLPQRPYMILGSLRQQLLYPSSDLLIGDEQLLEFLKQVNLPDLATRFGNFNAVEDWSKVLSLGEQQRLAFARLLLTKPVYAFLDEATSALDEKNEELLYQQLKETSITFISVGHRPTLLKYHQQVLELSSDQTWHLTSAADYHFSAKSY